MPRLSLYQPNRTNDYRFFDRTISEMYTVGGLDLYVHKYLGPKAGGEDSTESGNYDATQPLYSSENPLFIQDLLLLENRDRAYDKDVYRMRGVYNVQDIDFDLSQFGLFIQDGTLFITFHYNDMIDTFGRKLMSGDVIEVPNLRDLHPLDTAIPKALPRYYVVQDASYPSEGFSQTWQPHLWRVKATPMVNAQEYQEIINKPFVSEQIHDSGNFYPAGSIVNYGDNYYRANIDVPAGTEITNTTYWSTYTPPAEEIYGSTRTKDYELNDAILAQAELEVPLSGYDTVSFYIVPTTADGYPADPTAVTAGGGTSQTTTTTVEVPIRYTTGTVTLADSTELSASIGVEFPADPTDGDYALRTDFFPLRLYQYDSVQSNWDYQFLDGDSVLSYRLDSVEPVVTSESITVDSTTITAGSNPATPRSDGYTVGYLTGDGYAPNGLPVIPGVSFPTDPVDGTYCLRLDYFPNRLFRYDGKRWIRIEDNVRTDLTNGPLNQTLRSSFVNNPYTVRTTDQGDIPSRQSLSELLRPRADNGNDNGGFEPNRRPGTQPGQRNDG